ncbi:MAG TPA: helix-turn-helix domain-containing protein, partial [Lacipirellulaceae bacterium]|nr:helix-turn-helix domain-containing protein [Lacipirellulaceae bacterium]
GAGARLTPFHVQRVYQGGVGETPADTVRRLRLARAAEQIAYGEISVTEAAISAGYGSSQAFCRAFRRSYGVAPSRLKKAGPAWLAERKPPHPEFSFVDLPARIGWGMRYSGADWDGGWSCCQIIGRAFAESLWSPATGQMFIQYRSDPMGDADGTVDADICIVGSDERLGGLGLERVVLPGGSYAMLRLPGSLRAALPGCRQILHKRLAENGLARAAGPVLRRFVNDQALTPPSEWAFELFVPVEHRRETRPDDSYAEFAEQASLQQARASAS